MVRHLRDALLHARCAPFTTAAKVLALALAFVAVVAVAATIAYWRSADAGLVPKGSRIVEFTSWRERDHKKFMGPLPFSAPPLAQVLRSEIPQIEASTRLGYFEPIPIHADGRTVVLQGGEADGGIFDVFDIRLVEGSRDALRRQDAIVLTRPAAEKLFGSAAAVGRSVTLDDGRRKIVGAVTEGFGDPSRFNAGRLKFDFLVPMVEQPGGPEGWYQNWLSTFVRVPAANPAVMGTLRDHLRDISERRVPRNNRDPNERLGLGAIDFERDAELWVGFTLFGFEHADRSVTGLMRLIGWVILGVACLNYLNLSTAQALAQTKETATRRILGSDTVDLLIQNAIETALAVLAAVVIAAAFVVAASPVLKAQFGADVLPALAGGSGIFEVAAAIGASALVCALLPALTIIRARPADALRAGRAAAPHLLSPILVGAQFAIASALIVLVIMVGRQNAHIRSLALHRTDDPVVALTSPARGGVPMQTLREALAQDPAIRAVGGRAEPPWSGGQLTDVIGRTAETEMSVTQLGVEFGYFDAYQQKVLAGRVFDASRDDGLWSTFPGFNPPGPFHRERPDVERIVIDSDLAKRMGFASPRAAVGASLVTIAGADAPRLEIIGVVEPRFGMLHTINGRGIAYRLTAPLPGNTPLIRLDARHVDQGLAAVRRVWGQNANGADPVFKFEDELFEASFQLFNRLQLIFSALAIVAIAISATGLIGMAVHVTQRRLHEIGVRKVLGSDAGQIVRLLLTDFAKPVLIGNLIAWPAAYFAVEMYVASFASRAPLTAVPFLGALAVTLAIAILAVGARTLQAAAVRPAEVLRDA